MPTFAFLKDNVVTEIKKDPDENALMVLGNTHQIIDVTNMVPMPDEGWTHDGVNFIQPPDYVIKDMKITKLAFRQRFQMAEMAAIYTAMASNIVVKIMIDNLSMATYVDLSRTDTIQGVYYMVSLGILSAERANQVLTTPPTAIEHYQED